MPQETINLFRGIPTGNFSENIYSRANLGGSGGETTQEYMIVVGRILGELGGTSTEVGKNISGIFFVSPVFRISMQFP